MRVFITGATGFIGSYLIPELIEAGHEVVGLSRSEEGAAKIKQAGATAYLGDVNDHDRLRVGAQDADAVVHAAFNHDFGNVKKHSENDRKVIETLGDVLAGSDRPLIVTSGTGLVERSAPGAAVTETDNPSSSSKVPRGATEEAAEAVLAKGGCVMIVRLSQTHDTRHQGRIAHHIKMAREKGSVAYLGDGSNRLAAAHVTDAVRLYRLALERGKNGARYHAVAEEGVPLRAIAEVIGAGLKMPVVSLSDDAAKDYFGPLAGLAGLDMAATSALTRAELGWTSSGPDFLTDLRQMHWVAG